MSILIKGMQLPRACQVCPLSHWNKLDQLTGCELIRRYVPKDDEDFWNNDRPSWCPLVELPPHGRLGDLDRLLRDFLHDPLYPVLRKYNVEGWIAGHPTIIPAEEGEGMNNPNFNTILAEALARDKDVPTNADRIRDMTDEELANLLYRVETCRIMTNNWIEWLRSPAEDGEHEQQE